MILVTGQPNITKIIVQTRLGNNLVNEQVWEDVRQGERNYNLKIYAKFLKDKHTKQVNVESQIYNCHGLTFGSRRTRLYEIEKILNQDFYKIVNINDTQEGDIAIYIRESGVLHSGIVIGIVKGEQIEIPLILSKWGIMGEYVHLFNCCPYIEQSQDVKFYRIQNGKRNNRNYASSD